MVVNGKSSRDERRELHDVLGQSVDAKALSARRSRGASLSTRLADIAAVDRRERRRPSRWFVPDRCKDQARVKNGNRSLARYREEPAVDVVGQQPRRVGLSGLAGRPGVAKRKRLAQVASRRRPREVW